MTDEPSSSRKKGRADSESKNKRPSRKLNWRSRLRTTFRRYADRVLSADLAWTGAFIAVMLLLLGSQRCGGGFHDFKVGQPAPRDVRASYDIDVVDDALTAERIRQAAEEIPDVYVYDEGQRIRLGLALASVFERGRRLLEEVAVQGEERPEAAAAREFGERIPAPALDLLLKRRFDAELERTLTSALSRVLSGLIVGNKSLLEGKPAIVLLRKPGQHAERIESYDDFIEVEQAREQLARELNANLTARGPARAALVTFASSFIDANVHPDWEATTRRREEAVTQVPPVLTRIARGELLIKKGDPLTEQMLNRLNAARKASGTELRIRDLFSLAFVICLLAFFLHRYSGFHQRAFRRVKHLHALMVLMLLSILLLARGMLWLAGAVVDSLPDPFNQLSPYAYLIPLGAGSILITLLANGRIAIVYSAYVSFLFGTMLGGDFYAGLWALVVQLCGVYAISTYRERAALLRAGLVVGGGGAATAMAVETLRGGGDPIVHLYGAALAFAGGAFGVGLLISFSLPLLERLFNVLTDIRLLELSNVNNPLLSQLALKAPGSYNHSLVVGTLAEEAAKAVRANSLLCRVAAFYHDIGKINYAEYFVENQRGGNPHERLSPSMSSLIIASHVKDGIKMAREAGLPEQIIDIIPQHHGTRLMTYFYEKAKGSTDPALTEIKETDFRYPGPKPQTREAAIFMIADAVEAAARTVDEPTPNRLREVIRKVTNAVVLDGQLDSCDLTFADLDRIQQAFLRLLVSMYHHRVDYPGFDFRTPKGTTKQGVDAPPRAPANGASTRRNDDEATRKAGRENANRKAARGN